MLRDDLEDGALEQVSNHFLPSIFSFIKEVDIKQLASSTVAAANVVEASIGSDCDERLFFVQWWYPISFSALQADDSTFQDCDGIH